MPTSGYHSTGHTHAYRHSCEHTLRHIHHIYRIGGKRRKRNIVISIYTFFLTFNLSHACEETAQVYQVSLPSLWMDSNARYSPAILGPVDFLGSVPQPLSLHDPCNCLLNLQVFRRSTASPTFLSFYPSVHWRNLTSLNLFFLLYF